jgi:hypothetical protein
MITHVGTYEVVVPQRIKSKDRTGKQKANSSFFQKTSFTGDTDCEEKKEKDRKNVHKITQEDDHCHKQEAAEEHPESFQAVPGQGNQFFDGTP